MKGQAKLQDTGVRHLCKLWWGHNFWNNITYTMDWPYFVSEITPTVHVLDQILQQRMFTDYYLLYGCTIQVNLYMSAYRTSTFWSDLLYALNDSYPVGINHSKKLQHHLPAIVHYMNTYLCILTRINVIHFRTSIHSGRYCIFVDYMYMDDWKKQLIWNSMQSLFTVVILKFCTPNFNK